MGMLPAQVPPLQSSSTMEQEHDSLAADYGQTSIYLLTFVFFSFLL
jgi:hypothetical protein